MSNHHNEIAREEIFELWITQLEWEGWPRGARATYAEAALRTEKEWQERED